MTAACLLATAGLLAISVLALPDRAAVARAGLGQAAVSAPVPASDLLAVDLNEMLSLSRSEIVHLDLHAGPVERIKIPTMIETIADDQPITIDLWHYSNRAGGFGVSAHMEDGSFVEVDPGPERTMRGHIAELPGSIVAASLLDDGLHALVILPGVDDLIWIEPVATHLPLAGVDPAAHIVYRSSDAECENGVCGLNDRVVQPHGFVLRQFGQDKPAGGGSEGGVAGLTCETVLIGIDVDFLFVNIWGGQQNAINRVNNVMNNTNAIYESQLGIVHLISEIIVRTTNAPYNCGSGNGSAGNLLTQFQNVWSSAPESQIPRNVAHLFTGCTSIDAAGIAQLGGANVAGGTNFGVCRPNHYGLAVHQGSLACQTHVTAHELGHNWSAQHCDGTAGCSGTIMPAFFPPCSTTFNQFSLNQILNHKNSSHWGACTVPCAPVPPPNDDCSTAMLVATGNTPFSNENATTSGFAELICNFDGSFQIPSDVWFRHTATCTGTLHVSTCNSSPGFDTKVAVYGSECPSATGAALGCNKDSCGQLSEVEVPVVQGSTYHIRVGGHNGAQGQGVLSIQCVPPPPPDNNSCQTAIPVPSGDTPFTNVDATSTGFAELICNFDGSFQIPSDVWFLHTADCTGTLHVSTCESSPGFDTKIAVYGEMCPTGTGAALACNKDSCGQLSEVEVAVEEGGVYRIRVGGHNGAQGDGILSIDCIADEPPPPPPDNNTCEEAIIVPMGDTPFTNVNATTTGFAEAICDFDGSFQIPSDVWFVHAAECTGTLHVSTCESSPGFDTKIAVYGDSCPIGTGAALACNKDSCGQLSEVEVAVEEGLVYLIRVGGHNGAQGDAILSIDCIADEPPPPPPDNNTCEEAISVPMGDTPFTNVNATTTGFAEGLCNFDGSSQIPSDVWFVHTAECTGALHVSTCESSPGFDTKIAVYGALCPAGPDEALACNKDACAQLSEVEVAVEEGQVYRIRVGGHNRDQGHGVLSIDCIPDEPPPPACPADLTGSGSVGVPDLLELLSAWGSCPAPCPADLTGSGSVGVPDLLELLSAWGLCPD